MNNLVTHPEYTPLHRQMADELARLRTFFGAPVEIQQTKGGKLKQLEADGLAGDTIIFYYGDNGGVIPRSKRFLHESGVHVPRIVYFRRNGGTSRPQRQGRGSGNWCISLI